MRTRTPEEIRDAVRAEIPALVALRKRLAAYYAELSRTPEYQHRMKLEDEDPEAWKLNAPYWLAATLCEDDLGGALRDAIANLRKDTDPKAWAAEAERARKHFEKAARRAEEATAQVGI